MYIYNVTVNISDDAHEEWLDWMKKEHIPDVLRTGCFASYRILKLLFVNDEGHTYSIQYYFSGMGDIENYSQNFAPALQAEHKKKFGEKYTAFRTLLEEV